MLKPKTLTDRQQQVFNALVRYQRKHGYPPTNNELALLIGVSSTNSVTDHLRALEKKGAITITPHISRGIRINCSNLSTPVAEAEEIIRALIGGEQDAVALAQQWLSERGTGA